MRYMHVVPGVTAEAIKMLDRPLPKGMAPEETPEVAPVLVVFGSRPRERKNPLTDQGVDGAGKGI